LNVCCKIFSKIINEKLKQCSEKFLLEKQKWIQGRLFFYRSGFPCETYYWKRRELNLETHLAFIDYGKASYKVKRHFI
jgi:hypothetical protein